MPTDTTPISLPSRKTAAVAAKILACGLLGHGGKASADGIRPEQALAETLGHDSWHDLAASAETWTPKATAFTREARAEAAETMARLTGLGLYACGVLLDLMNLDGKPVDEEAVMATLERRYYAHPQKAAVIGFFKAFPFLLDEASLALDLRAAGKPKDKRLNAADDGTLDILDCVDHALEGGGANPIVITAPYYAIGNHHTVGCENPMLLFDSNAALLEEDLGNLKEFLYTARDYPAGRGLDHLVVSSMLFEPPFPLPGTHDEIDAAASFYKTMFPIVTEHFGVAAVNACFDEEDWPGSWQELADKFKRQEYSMEALLEGRQRIADFVNAYVDHDAPITAMDVEFNGFTVRELHEESVRVADLSDRLLAQRLGSLDGRSWRVEDWDTREQLIPQAVKACLGGKEPRKLVPRQENTDTFWMDNPELSRLSAELNDVAWKRPGLNRP